MSATTKHYVTFFYPGTFFDEEAVLEIPTRDGAIEAPLDAFGYQEWDREEVESDGETLRGKPKNHGPMVYFGTTLTVDDVEQLRPSDRYSILLSNMRCNRWERVVRTDRGNFKPLTGDVQVLPSRTPVSV